MRRKEEMELSFGGFTGRVGPLPKAEKHALLHPLTYIQESNHMKIANTLTDRLLASLPRPPPPLVCSLFTVPVAVVAVPLALAVQLSEPHANPLGQHPPPSPSAHPNHPLAQASVAVAFASDSDSGATIVSRPLDATVVETVAGQDVVSQFRAVRQHPPW